MVAEYYPRRMHDRVLALLEEESVVLLAGPRACGKSFTCERVIRSLNGTILRLDDPAERRVARADPTGYILHRQHPILIDEYQHVPELLSAIKADLSRTGAAPGRFLLTGSVRGDVAGAQESLTGRIHRARLHPLSQGEYRRQSPEPFLVGLLRGGEEFEGWRDPRPLTSYEYLDIVCRGGFPIAVDRNPSARTRWFRDYVEDTVLRDALDQAKIRKPNEMKRLLQLLAARTGQIVKSGSIENDLQLDRHTITAYQHVLEGLFLVEHLPPWRTNRSQRVIKAPKLHLADTALAAAVLGLDVDGLRSDPATAGHLVESFVVTELAKQASWLEEPPALLHFCESERAEVDLVLERPDGRVLGLEVKLADHVEARDLRGLRRFRELAGHRFEGGVVLCAVPGAYRTEDGLLVAPISAVWNIGVV